jgi:transcriptional regulator with XRE-family HTH domain
MEQRTLTSIGALVAQLETIRLEQGITKAELARKTGVGQSAIWHDERGQYQHATVRRLDPILAALGVRVTITVTPIEKEHADV